MDLRETLPKEFVDGLILMLGRVDAEALLRPLYQPDGIAQIQRPDHPHSQAISWLLHV
jgi:hypothetical protein